MPYPFAAPESIIIVNDEGTPIGHATWKLVHRIFMYQENPGFVPKPNSPAIKFLDGDGALLVRITKAELGQAFTDQEFQANTMFYIQTDPCYYEV